MWIPTSYYWGRAPLLFWTNLIGTFFILGCALSTNFQMYYVFRALQGLFLTCGQSIAVALIKDIFFLHEQARKIGIVMIVILVAPSLGPQWVGDAFGTTLHCMRQILIMIDPRLIGCSLVWRHGVQRFGFHSLLAALLLFSCFGRWMRHSIAATWIGLITTIRQKHQTTVAEYPGCLESHKHAHLNVSIS